MKPALHLPGRAPDLFSVANAHLDRLKNTYLDGLADLVVEIISPVGEQAEFYQLGDNGIYHLVPADALGKYHSPMLPGLWLQVDWLWQTPLSVLKAWGLV
jgi:Uma2 family endonuclease